MMCTQSHKNIIWNPNFVSNHISLITFVESIEIQVTFFFGLFDKIFDYKERAFCFRNYVLFLVKKYTEMVL